MTSQPTVSEFKHTSDKSYKKKVHKRKYKQKQKLKALKTINAVIPLCFCSF